MNIHLHPTEGVIERKRTERDLQIYRISEKHIKSGLFVLQEIVIATQIKTAAVSKCGQKHKQNKYICCFNIENNKCLIKNDKT